MFIAQCNVFEGDKGIKMDESGFIVECDGSRRGKGENKNQEGEGREQPEKRRWQLL